MGKYNIALLPVRKNNEIVEYTQTFAPLSEQYLLSENSFAHVTICQFYADEDKVEGIWQDVCDALETHALDLTFQQFSCLSFDEHVFWVSLLPDNIPMLQEMHSEVIKIIKPINEKVFDPHLTLFNTRNKEYKQIIEKDLNQYSPISDQFILSLGECDKVGQFTRLIEQCHSNSCSLSY